MTLFREDGSTNHKCSNEKCGRPVRQTMHSIDGAKVDFYIISWEVGKEPVVLCVECYKER